MKRLFSSLLLVLALAAQTRIVSPADIVGDGATHAINATEFARWVIVKAKDSNGTTHCSTSDMTACPRVGGINTSQTVGTSLLPGAALMYPTLPTGQPGYALSQINYWAATQAQSGGTAADGLQITWAK